MAERRSPPFTIYAMHLDSNSSGAPLARVFLLLSSITEPDTAYSKELFDAQDVEWITPRIDNTSHERNVSINSAIPDIQSTL